MLARTQKVFSLLLERGEGRERERNIDWLHFSYVLHLGIKPMMLRSVGQGSNQLSHTSQGPGPRTSSAKPEKPRAYLLRHKESEAEFG